MKTTATNRKIRVLLKAIEDGDLEPQPEFQRRLVWTNKHKSAFIQTVLDGYPFPEIYIAAGDVNPDTAEGKEMLVDGQQRITTLQQYFSNSADLKLSPGVPGYLELRDDQKKNFLEYEVVIRDLGNLSTPEIKEVFQRINSTNYSLNAMEIHNARYDGEFKRFGEEVAGNEFWEKHKIFQTSEIRRMSDIRFVLTFIVTIMSTYFTRDNELEVYLNRYNDEFELVDDLRREIQTTLQFIDTCDFDAKSRAWKKADLLTLLVEVHTILIKQQGELEVGGVSQRVKNFYRLVDNIEVGKETNKDVAEYHQAALQASNDRTNRITRGRILQSVIKGEFTQTDN